MGIFRLPLAISKSIGFFKLMGCGKNGTFDKKPDTQQWAILAVHKTNTSDLSVTSLYGRFINKWLQAYKCETYTIMLEPVEGHGKWDGKEVFGKLPHTSAYNGPVAILTRATIRLSKLGDFWDHVAPVAAKMSSAKGLLFSIGIGEVPWVKQATFSVWENKDDMKAFAYKLSEHTDVIRKTRDRDWYSEEMFVRFRVTDTNGTIHSMNPLQHIN